MRAAYGPAPPLLPYPPIGYDPENKTLNGIKNVCYELRSSH
ncbi:hypothetical protein [Borreliella bavariensis]|nr:hypothetical protein [Borreliella bavariensis]